MYLASIEIDINARDNASKAIDRIEGKINTFQKKQDLKSGIGDSIMSKLETSLISNKMMVDDILKKSIFYFR